MRIVLTILCFILVHVTFSQATYRSGLVPVLNINSKINTTWKVNFKAESRFITSEGLTSSIEPVDVTFSRTDLSGIFSRKVGSNKKLALGYLIRLTENEPGHRFIQQYTIVQRISSFRMSHRFSTDQTFIKNDPTSIRLRYRITPIFSLEGQSIDNNEFYLKVNNEYLNIFKDSEHDLEIRLVPLLGYAFNDNNKMEFGLDYRVNKFLDSAPNHNYWITLNWFISL